MIWFNDRLFNTSEIKEVRQDDKGIWIMQLVDGLAYRSATTPHETAVIPAEPGRFEVVSVFHDDGDQFTIDRYPVVAWRVAAALSGSTADHWAEPITVNQGAGISECCFHFDKKTGMAWIPLFEMDGSFDSILETAKERASALAQ
jgi:hypothetical protein